MAYDRRQFLASSLLATGGISTAGETAVVGTIDDARILPLRGRVVCLTEEYQKPYQLTPDCDARGHVYTLKSEDAKYYPFLPTDTAAAVWLDERYRTRDLQVTVRLFPQTNFIEVIKFQSLKNGKLFDLYYYCDICAITAHKPGACECCQEPVEFRETPEGALVVGAAPSN
jgi:hypothetical protein